MTTHESNAAPSRRAARGGDSQDARVVTMLQELSPHLAAEPDPEFRRATRQRLVAMAAVRTPEPVRPSPLRRLLAARAADAPAGRWRTRATAGLAGAALTVTSLATLVALSTAAQPGDVLYGVKRGTEQTQLALAGDSRGQALLDLARTRLDELADLDGDASLVRSTLATMDEQTREGASWHLTRALDTSDTASLDRLSGWTADQSAQLDAVRAEVPAAAADDVAGSLGLLAEITERVDVLRAALDCPTGPAIAGADRLGPVPGGCVPTTPAPQSPVAPVGPDGSVPESPAPTTAPDPAADPTVPAGPGGGQPTPAPAPLPAPGNQPAPAPVPVPAPVPSPSSAPGGLLPLPLPLPGLPPAPSSPAPSTATPKPVLDVPLGPLPLGVCVGGLLHLGEC
ncbi:DUF5667 domain-containing protein [Blastococcus sp. SYSU DS0617]